MFRKLLITLAAVLCAGGAAFGITQAGANLRTNVYADVSNGTAGYYATNGTPFHNVNAVITTTPASLNIGGAGKGGIGVQLCDPNNGFGLQIGLTSNGTSFSVQYATGTLAGAATDHCVGNGVLANPQTLNTALTNLPVGDAVTVYVSYGVYRNHSTRMHWAGVANFQAMDANGFEIFSKNVWHLPVDHFIDMAGAGVQQDTTGLTGGCVPVTLAIDPAYPVYGTTPPNQTAACKDAADFSGVFANGTGGIGGFAGNGTGSGLANWNVTEVVTSVGGLKVNDPIVSPNHTLVPVTGAADSAFSVFTA